MQIFVYYDYYIFSFGTVELLFNDIKEKSEKYKKLLTAIYLLNAEAADFFLLKISIFCLHVANGESFCCFNKS